MSLVRCVAPFWTVWLTALAVTATASAEQIITPKARQLARVLDSMHVERLWLPGMPVNWRTGEPDGRRYTSAGPHTHCSAFVAAACERLRIYILRPPAHSAVLLANAQYRWLNGPGQQRGWMPVAGAVRAQRLANKGVVVVAAWLNPDPKKPGHIAIVRPSTKSLAAIQRDGPDIIQAGNHNTRRTSVHHGFANHRGAWANNEVRFFAHVWRPQGS